ncbi:hypothetical protein AVEN_83811-1 [Araneus ventricosus]|uniref:Uncharacterized protein n=1 Tax=Araneus ventricosus TaxID=182803 RepID=A0A4Y2MR44_ARAVE|nr:hypothetical protein AVEN_83811-1 [Araneus ventricosus]
MEEILVVEAQFHQPICRDQGRQANCVIKSCSPGDFFILRFVLTSEETALRTPQMSAAWAIAYGHSDPLGLLRLLSPVSKRDFRSDGIFLLSR